MFVDQVEIDVESGGGGNGAVTFRTEKYVPHGGPSGGDGGRGGSVRLVVNSHLSTLLDFRYKRHYKAQRGGDGRTKDMHGKNGADLVLKVPNGTMVYDADSGELLADLTADEDKFVIAKGGVGGRGNAQFATSVRQAPRYAENGEPGVAKKLRLELKLLADVGLLGYPSVGKSTLLAAVSAARPKVADYPFTTLVPNLGVVAVEPGTSYVMADLPGLIEGAHEGVGLGIQFLRHVERTRVLVHMLDVSGLSGREPIEDYRIINLELAAYSPELADAPQIVALNKMDIAQDIAAVDDLQLELEADGRRVFRISAATKQGVKELLWAVWEVIQSERIRLEKLAQTEQAVLITPSPDDDPRRWNVERTGDDQFRLNGKGFTRMVAMTDLNNEHGVTRLQLSLERAGVYTRLREIGAKEGDTVTIGEAEFEFQDEDLLEQRYARPTRASRTRGRELPA